MVTPWVSLWMLLIALGLSEPSDPVPAYQAHVEGISLMASRHSMNSKVFEEIHSTGANYVCLLPFAFMRSENPEIYYGNNQWWGETPAGLRACMRLAHERKLKVMIKPQIWMHDKYSGHLTCQHEEGWRQLEKEYSAFIFKILQVADSMNAEMFCIGSELDSFVILRPRYWSNLIDSIRKIYPGKITYAANWDRYEKISFWQKMDYIGINAYFPLSDEVTPSAISLQKGWKAHCMNMHSLSVKTGKPVLFTEFGYRSIDYSAKEPWNSYQSSNANEQAQKNSYEALFRECWNQSWFAGGFCWKWFDENSQPDVSHETDYTPQQKTAEQVLRKWYSAQ